MELGTAASQVGSVLTISSESWAPGLWAGLEWTYLDNGAQVKAIDLANRLIYLDTATRPYQRGQSIELIGSQHVQRVLELAVAAFSYKPEYELKLIRELNGSLSIRLSAKVGTETYFLRRTFSLLNPDLTQEKVMHNIFEMVQQLEREIIIKSLKFRGQQYLTDSPR